MSVSRQKLPKRSLHRFMSRGFERFEDRSLMSAAPAAPHAALAAVAIDTDVDDEAIATAMLNQRRNFMQQTGDAVLNQYGGANIGLQPIIKVHQGRELRGIRPAAVAAGRAARVTNRAGLSHPLDIEG